MRSRSPRHPQDPHPRQSGTPSSVPGRTRQMHEPLRTQCLEMLHMSDGFLQREAVFPVNMVYMCVWGSTLTSLSKKGFSANSNSKPKLRMSSFSDTRTSRRNLRGVPENVID